MKPWPKGHSCREDAISYAARRAFSDDDDEMIWGFEWIFFVKISSDHPEDYDLISELMRRQMLRRDKALEGAGLDTSALQEDS